MHQSHQDTQTICHLLDTRIDGTLREAAYVAAVRVPLKRIIGRNGRHEYVIRHLSCNDANF